MFNTALNISPRCKSRTRRQYNNPNPKSNSSMEISDLMTLFRPAVFRRPIFPLQIFVRRFSSVHLIGGAFFRPHIFSSDVFFLSTFVRPNNFFVQTICRPKIFRRLNFLSYVFVWTPFSMFFVRSFISFVSIFGPLLACISFKGTIPP